ncbi:BTAD domain-containing putative transcriptional regulator [Spirillospora sp. CA-255316]
MMSDLPVPLVERRRLRAPRARAAIATRPRLNALLDWALTHPLTLVEAEAGYGKTTLAQAAPADLPRVWYTLSSDDCDPTVFFAHLASALEPFCPALPQRLASRRPGPERAETSWSELVELVLAELEGIAGSGLLIVLDDYHQVDTPPINLILDRLVEGLPPGLRILATTRVRPALAGLVRWQATGAACIITRADLAFTTEEVAGFWQARFGLDVSPEQAALLTRETEGWPIAMGLIGAHLRHRGADVDALAEKLPAGRDELFAYLGEQVVSRLPDGLRTFLLATAAPRSFDEALARHLSGRADAARVLRQVLTAGLFCTGDDRGSYRYHHLFRDFLLAQLDEAQRHDGHLRTADHLERSGEIEEALFHAFEACDDERAARLLARLGGPWIAAGRHQAFLDASGRLPAEVRASSPCLLIHRSRALRLACDYPAAVAEARAAALHTDALTDALKAEIDVYLDTVQPRQAAPLLARLRRTVRDQEQLVGWLVMLTEHHVNAGAPDRARRARLRHAALSGGTPGPDVRLEVRAGDLHQARRLLEAVDEEALPVHRSHREREPLLAWTHGLLGNRDQAAEHARRGIARGQDRGSHSVLFVSTSRLAHSLLCGDTGATSDLMAAVRHYRTALSVVARTGVPRLRAESLIGLTVASGRLGDADAVRRHGTEALELLTEAGDSYMAAMACLAMGVGAAYVHHPDASTHLMEARSRARRSADVYIPTLADIWLAQLALERGDADAFRRHAGPALATTREYGLDALLVHAPWLGIPGVQRRRAWLRQASGTPALVEYARYLLGRLAADTDIASKPAPAAPAPAAPAPELRLLTLGRFCALRDGEPIPPTRWERRKARELLWLLSSREQRSVLRDEALELLWPDTDPEVTAPRFRVALHALRGAVEPDRKSRGQARFVHTDGDRITLDPCVQIDWTEFRRLARRALDADSEQDAIALGRQAITLYQGAYLEDAVDLPWAEGLRESLRVTFIQLALRTAEAEFAEGALSAAAELAHRVLDVDRYLEGAYRLLAQVHLSSGDSAAAQRTFRTCAARLKADLGVTPSWRISDL